jgi:hypothetical protein
VAVERAAAGEQVTTAVARQTLAAAREKAARVASRFPFEELRPNLTQLLRRHKARCRPEDFQELARRLQGFDETLEMLVRAGGKRHVSHQGHQQCGAALAGSSPGDSLRNATGAAFAVVTLPMASIGSVLGPSSSK